MLEHEDEQTLALWGWNSFEQVYGYVPGLAWELVAFRYEPINQPTIRMAVKATYEYLRKVNHPCMDGGQPELDFWHPPGSKSLVLMVKRKDSTHGK
jgi:hypothetical protein